MSSRLFAVSESRRERWIELVPYLCILVAICVVSWHIAQRFLYELSAPLTADTPLYLTVGRGILNGLTPYQDLFENKPPGIFLLSALSLKLFDSPFLGSVIGALSLLIFPLVPTYIAWRDASKPTRLLLSSLSFVVGGLIGLYAASRSGEFQVESFGALFAVLYLLCVLTPQKLSAKRVFIASVFLLASIGMKEPFLLTIMGAIVVVFIERPYAILVRFILPLVIAAAMGLAIAAASGMLIPYVYSYLATTFSAQIVQNGTMHPLFYSEKFFDAVYRICIDLWQFSQSFCVLIVLLVLAGIVGDLFVKFSFKNLIKNILSILILVVLATIAVGMKGDFYNHHFVFAVPVYLALYLVFLRKIKVKNSNFVFSTLIACVFLASVLAGFQYYAPDYEVQTNYIQSEIKNAQSAADYVDRVMDKCKFERYLYIGTNGIDVYGFTKHSPLGPAFIQYGYFMTNPIYRSFRDSFLNNLRITPLIVYKDTRNLDDIALSTEGEIKHSFTEVPPSCAAEEKRGKVEYRILYRI